MDEDQLGGFGDGRLRRVGAALLAAMEQTPTMCVHALADGRNQTVQFGRFLDNEAVSAEEMLVYAGKLTGRRAKGRHVLAIQDTTELHFPGHPVSKRGFGRAGNGHDIGLFLHPTIAIDAEGGGMIGLVGAQVLNRVTPKVPSPSADKESRRWLIGAETAGAVLTGAAMITVVADRESDIYEQFARRPATVHLLTRAAQDRAVAEGGRLFAYAAALPLAERYTIAVPHHGQRPARNAEVMLRFGTVTLRRPKVAGRTLPEQVELQVVDVAEISPPLSEPPVHWCLLTTHPLANAAAARQVVAWYRARWTIEQVFRTLKSAGAEAENSQLETAKRFVKLAVVALIAAVRTIQLVLGRDGTTVQPLTDAVDLADAPALVAINTKVEGRTEKLKNPYASDTLAWFAWIVARLGGWFGYTSRGYKPAGPKTFARGLRKLDAMLQGWRLGRYAYV